MLRDTQLIFVRDMKLALLQPDLAAHRDHAAAPVPVPLRAPHGVRGRPHPGFPPGGAWEVLTPALIVQTALFSGSFAGVGLLTEYRVGVVDRFRGTPASTGRPAVRQGPGPGRAGHRAVRTDRAGDAARLRPRRLTDRAAAQPGDRRGPGHHTVPHRDRTHWRWFSRARPRSPRS
ncbi:hypothetical protein LV779_36000 [Streptomyces thinghirensis]|nr:hypothetical protein [Streptomyces thinghirensis]